MLKVNLTNKTT